MRTTTQALRGHRIDRSQIGGFALPAALAVLILLSVLMVTVYANAMATFRSGTSDLGKTRTLFAAEAGAEMGLARVADLIEGSSLNDSAIAAIPPPVMAEFTFDSFSVTKVGGVIPERLTDGPFTGLYSLTQMIEVYSEASDAANNSSAVVVTAKAQAIPIFQFGVFYEKDLEITNGPRLDFAGWVHSNGNIYLSSNNQYFQDLITTPNKVFHDRKDYHNVFNGVYIQDATATDVQLLFDSRSEPIPSDFQTRSNLDFDDRLMTDAYGVDSLQMPLPAGVDPATIMDPRSGADGPLERQAKYAWKADYYIDLDMSGVNPANLCAMLTVSMTVRDHPVQNVIPDVVTCNTIFSLGIDAWYEGREQRYVDVLNVDLGALFAWAGSNPGRRTSVLFITFSGTGLDPQLDGNYPIVRLRNGSVLGNPITIGSSHPLYVDGDYNSVGWTPSGLIGDAITILSNAWNDGDHLLPTQIRPNAADTQVYAAILAGHSGTPCDHEDGLCGATSPYGGGLENFPRFLENWGGQTLTYRGSLVSLHFSQKSTGLWGNGPYYSPPARDWEFDTRFEDPTQLPPGTPVVGNVVHTAFRPIR